MQHLLKRRTLAAAMVAAAITAAGCSGGGSSDTGGTSDASGSSDTAGTSDTSGSGSSISSTDPEMATLRVRASRVDVNDTEVPKGGTRPLQLDEPVVLGTGALADVQAGDLAIVLLLETNMRLDSWDRPELRSSLQGGHLRVTVGANTTARFRLSTWTKVVLTTRQPGTEFIVCQTPVAPPEEPVTCLEVIKGEVEWEAKGTSTILTAGQSTFSKNGDPPGEVKCLPTVDVDAWYQAALRGEPVDALGILVSNAPPCAADGSTTSTETTVATETTQRTGQRPRPPSTTGPPDSSAQPPPTDTVQPPPTDTVQPPPTDTVQPPPTDTVQPPVDTTPPPPTT
jgi:hypothetical protein